MSQSMKILIFGGSGFVSGHLAGMAMARGHEVWTVTRGNGAVPPGVRPIIADRSDGEALDIALGGAGIHITVCFVSEISEHFIFLSAKSPYTAARSECGRSDRYYNRQA